MKFPSRGFAFSVLRLVNWDRHKPSCQHNWSFFLFPERRGSETLRVFLGGHWSRSLKKWACASMTCSHLLVEHQVFCCWFGLGWTESRDAIAQKWPSVEGGILGNNVKNTMEKAPLSFLQFQFDVSLKFFFEGNFEGPYLIFMTFLKRQRESEINSQVVVPWSPEPFNHPTF